MLERPIPAARAHDLEVVLGAGRASVVVDGSAVVRLAVGRTASGGVGVMAKREAPASPVPVLSSLRIDPGATSTPADG